MGAPVRRIARLMLRRAAPDTATMLAYGATHFVLVAIMLSLLIPAANLLIGG